MNKLTQIIRSLLRDRLNTSVMIVSLAIGIAGISLIFLFINREIGTDSFHEKRERIYALKCDDPWVKGAKMYHCRYGSAEYMKDNFAAVEDFCRMFGAGAQKVVVNDEEYFDRPYILAASENFFRFFSYDLLTKNQETALDTENSIVISTELAKKYFGSADPVGKIINLINIDNKEQMVVTGIFQKPENNTQILFDMVRLIGEKDSRCYLLLAENANPAEMETLFFGKKESIPVIHDGTPGSYSLEPFQKTYFNTSRGASFEATRDKTDLWIALIIGLMIIGVAIFNYLGILANKYQKKIKEYYIRRINGSSMINLIGRFMLENSIIVVFSFVLSLLILPEVLPFFNSMTNSKITEQFIFRQESLAILIAVLIFILLLTLIFASNLIYSNLSLNFLKADQNQKRGMIQIPAFNVFQIAASIALIISSIIIIRQMNFITNKPIGLDKKVIEVKIPGQYKDKTGVFKEELLSHNTINNVSIVGASPVLEHFLVSLHYQENGKEKQYSPSGFSGDENYLKVLDIELVEGNDFSEILSSNTKKCLINQTFASIFAGQSLVGKGIPGMEDMTVTGIVKDFHYSGLKSGIEPAFISFDNKGRHLLVKATDGMTFEARNTIEQVWQKIIPDYPVNIESVGDRYEWFHRDNTNFKRLIVSCSVISLFLSMIGLFALSFQKAHSRTKEIGIRKINGATISEILLLINKDFIRWTLIAFAIALPASWYAMHQWLENYAYKTELPWWIYAFSGAIVLVIALSTVSWHSWRAATKNPVEALRYE
jgi:putative ABC transport system permease protein